MKMTKVEIKKAWKRIADRERRFKKMSAANKRVAIAKDVIEQIKIGKIKATSGDYFQFAPLDNANDKSCGYDKRGNYSEDNIDEKAVMAQVRDLLVENRPSCTACAVGAIFTCIVLRTNNYTVNDFNYYDVWGPAKRFFSKEQLALMETAFETMEISGRSNNDDDAIAFGEMFKRDRDRLIAIMQNVIKNKGKFIPPKVDRDYDF